MSSQQASLLAIRNYVIILPFLKPGIPKTQGASYRHISLLCPASKVLEKLMLQRIAPHPRLAETQLGFHAGDSTTTALPPMVQHTANDFNWCSPPRRTVIIAVDFSKAFDTVKHTALLRSLSRSTLDSNTIQWLRNYLRGRTVSCNYSERESISIPKKQVTGSPTGLCPLPCALQLLRCFVFTNCGPLHLTYG